MGFSHWDWDSCQNLVLENKCLNAFKDPEEDEEDADILNPGKFDGFPEARTIGGGRSQGRNNDKIRHHTPESGVSNIRP